MTAAGCHATTRARVSRTRKPRRQIQKGGLRGEQGAKDGDDGVVQPRHYQIGGALRRRDALVAFFASVAGASASAATAAETIAAAPDVETLLRLQREAAAAYDAQDFNRAFDALSQLRKADPSNPSWLEGRAQVGVDAKKFEDAISDYTTLLDMVDPDKDGGSAARFRAGRALAYEGLYAWPLALKVRRGFPFGGRDERESYVQNVDVESVSE